MTFDFIRNLYKALFKYKERSVFKSFYYLIKFFILFYKLILLFNSFINRDYKLKNN